MRHHEHPVATRLRAVRADWGYFTPIALLPALWATEWWGAVGFYVVAVGAPLVTCVAHRLVYPEIEPEDPNTY